MSFLEGCERKRTWVHIPNVHVKVRHNQVNVTTVFRNRNS